MSKRRGNSSLTSVTGSSSWTISSGLATGGCRAVSRSRIPFRSFLHPTAQSSTKSTLSTAGKYWHLTRPPGLAGEQEKKTTQHLSVRRFEGAHQHYLSPMEYDFEIIICLICTCVDFHCLSVLHHIKQCLVWNTLIFGHIKLSHPQEQTEKQNQKLSNNF